MFEKDILKEIIFPKNYRYTASMIFDAYDPTDSVSFCSEYYTQRNWNFREDTCAPRED